MAAAAATLYDKKKPDKGGKDDAAKKPDDAKPADAKAADAKTAEDAAPDPLEALMGDFKAMHKRHETERRDAHGNQRELLRTMTGRHEKEIGDMMERIRVSGTPAPAGAGGSEGAAAEEA